MTGFLLSSAVLGTLGAALATFLLVASRRFHVDEDPLIDVVEAELPGANCGACGGGGCRTFAETVVATRDQKMYCPPGGNPVLLRVSEVLGMEVAEREVPVAVVMCRGDNSAAGRLGVYAGIGDCRAASVLGGTSKLCPFGCVGLGSCVKACRYEAIEVVDGVARVDEPRCVGCAACVEACPFDLVQMMPRSRRVFVACMSEDPGKQVKRICSVGCVGCRKCVKACDDEAMSCGETLAAVNVSLCTQCGACIASCPQVTVVGVHLDAEALARARRPLKRAKKPAADDARSAP